MTNSEKLRALADWFDLYDKKDLTVQIKQEVQQDLRAMATEFEQLQQHGVMQAACQHEIVDARNKVISSGYMCVKCNAVFKAAAVGNSAAGQNGSVGLCKHEEVIYYKGYICKQCDLPILC